MGKTLVIAEKPSVATDIAKVLKAKRDKSKDFFENDEYVISSAVGHLLELAVPEKHDIKRGKWSFDKLPHLPPQFTLKPIAKSESRLKVLKRLIKRKDIDTLVNACDAGREGELIFRYIVQHAKSKQPSKRLWLQSMTPAAIREGFTQLRDDESMLPLAAAATCRSEADWLVGINGTRAMTAFNSKGGGFFLTTVGRVQTPTLAVVVEREQAIKDFISQDYWEVHATFQADAGEYTGRWFDENFKRDENDAHKRTERIWDQAKAETIKNTCEGQPGEVTEESKPSKQAPPLLYDLTTLQRDANSRFGFSARNTLAIAQALYERHKVCTYPRTDSKALPEDYPPTVRKTLEQLAAGHYGQLADKVLKNDWVVPGNKRIFNNAKISDHFAIIPTLQAPKNLKEQEQKVYDLIAKRFLAIFYPSAEFEVTTRITRVKNEPFKTEGKVMVKPGWHEVYGKDQQGETLTPIKSGEKVKTTEVEVEGKETKPPARYSEATLLSAMEHAGRLVDDEELREAMSEKGLGTPATRANIIEELIRHKYLVRENRELIPTAQAFQLITLLNGLEVEALSKPELTGDWENKLHEIERGKLDRDSFMSEIRSMTEEIVNRAKSYENDTIPGDYVELTTPCPKCGGLIKENYRRFSCSKADCDFDFGKAMGGRFFEIPEVEELLTNRTIGPLQGFRSKMGRPFAAIIHITDEQKVEFDFGNDEEDEEPPDFSGQEPVGKCLACAASVFEHGMRYVCEKTPEKKCKFSTGKVILQREMSREEVAKLLETGKTDLLEKFISKKGRPFKAYLVWDEKKKQTAFEFEPRAPKAPKSAKKKASKEKS
ncbi:MAG TPA: DNA topoisomerase III [Verrucomicrobiales bacterium]|nr:DNA topoisomerase III [Verrucomicrobiales bacterium]